VADESGFEIKHPEAKEGRFYSWPASFRLGDTVLIEKVTGLSWPEFTERVPEEDEAIPEMAGSEDMVVLVGLMAAGIWQAHPTWRRDKVVQYVERLDQDRVTFIGADVDEPEEGEERPPDQTEVAGATTSETSPPPSTTDLDSPSDETTPSSSGDQTSDTGPDSEPTT
jgi:hypothetical protein